MLPPVYLVLYTDTAAISSVRRVPWPTSAAAPFAIAVSAVHSEPRVFAITRRGSIA